MSQLSSVSPSYRSPVTLGDFVKGRRSSKGGAKSSPEQRQVSNHRNLFPQDDPIDFSVNDIQFEKVQKKKGAMKELKWSENDVDFTIDNKTCSYKKCLKNDDYVRPFNNFRVPSLSYASAEADINFNNEHFFLPEAQQFGSGGLAPAEDAAAATVSYFPFDRVEVEEVGLGPGAWYQGTTYYALEAQLPCLDTLATDLCSLDLSTASSVPEADTSQVRGRVEDIEKDEELNNIVIAIIDD